MYAFTLFSWDGRGFQCFGLVRVFHDEEHSIMSRVLWISSSDNVVHAFIEGVRVISDAARIKMKSLFYQGCDFSYRQWN